MPPTLATEFGVFSHLIFDQQAQNLFESQLSIFAALFLLYGVHKDFAVRLMYGNFTMSKEVTLMHMMDGEHEYSTVVPLTTFHEKLMRPRTYCVRNDTVVVLEYEDPAVAHLTVRPDLPVPFLNAFRNIVRHSSIGHLIGICPRRENTRHVMVRDKETYPIGFVSPSDPVFDVESNKYNLINTEYKFDKSSTNIGPSNIAAQTTGTTESLTATEPIITAQALSVVKF